MKTNTKLHFGSNRQTRRIKTGQTQQRLASLIFVGSFRQSQFLPHKMQLSHNNKIHDKIKYMIYNTPGREGTKYYVIFWGSCHLSPTPWQLDFFPIIPIMWATLKNRHTQFLDANSLWWHLIFVDTREEIVSWSPLWCLEFCGGPRFLEKFCTPALTHFWGVVNTVVYILLFVVLCKYIFLFHFLILAHFIKFS